MQWMCWKVLATAIPAGKEAGEEEGQSGDNRLPWGGGAKWTHSGSFTSQPLASLSDRVPVPAVLRSSVVVQWGQNGGFMHSPEMTPAMT